MAILLAATAGVVFSYNLFGFPSYFQDEGVYLSQAHSVTTDGKLAPYTYWYDHPPGGWIFIGAWMELSGGYFIFGNSLDTGRIFVLALHVASFSILFWMILRLTGSILLASLGALLFALSPYWLIQGRQLMLEPVAIFWLLSAMALLFVYRPTLMTYSLSGLFLAFSILSKETMVAFLPGMAWLAWLTMESAVRRVALALWGTIFGSMISVYVLYAILKGELFPPGKPLGLNGYEHVSLIGTMQWHMSRENDNGLLDFGSRFWSNSVAHWFDMDPLLTVAAPICILACALLGFRQRLFWPLGLMILGFVLFLGRGGVVFDFYALPLVPLVAFTLVLIIAEIAHDLRSLAGRWRFCRADPSVSFGFGLTDLGWISIYLLILAGLFSAVGVAAANGDSYRRWYESAFTYDNTSSQRSAVDWVKENVPEDQFVMISGYALLELPLDYPLAHWYWKVERDPEIFDDLMQGDWRMVDYAIITPNMEEEARAGVIPFVATIMSHGESVAIFERDGYWVKVIKIQKEPPAPAAPVDQSLPPANVLPPPPPPAPALTPSAPSFRVHTVQRGDALALIAQRYNVSYQQLHQANRAVIGDNPNMLVPSQQIVIPGGG